MAEIEKGIGDHLQISDFSFYHRIMGDPIADSACWQESFPTRLHMIRGD